MRPYLRVELVDVFIILHVNFYVVRYSTATKTHMCRDISYFVLANLKVEFGVF